MRTTVEDVHQRNRKGDGIYTAQVPVKVEVAGLSTCFCYCHRNSQCCIGAQFGFVCCSIYINQHPVHQGLIGNRNAQELGGNDIVYVVNRLQHAFSYINGLVAITELNGFVLTGGSA